MLSMTMYNVIVPCRNDKAFNREVSGLTFLYPPQNKVLGGYTVFSLSVIPSFRDSVTP